VQVRGSKASPFSRYVSMSLLFDFDDLLDDAFVASLTEEKSVASPWESDPS